MQIKTSVDLIKYIVKYRFEDAYMHTRPSVLVIQNTNTGGAFFGILKSNMPIAYSIGC